MSSTFATERMGRATRRATEWGTVLPILSLLLSLIGGVVVWLTVSIGKHSLASQRQAKRLRRKRRAVEPERLRQNVAEGSNYLDLLTARLKQSEALVAERDATIAALQAQFGAAPEGSAAFRRLRALILRELHPDHAPEGRVERTQRQEVFKRLWPQVEGLSSSPPAGGRPALHETVSSVPCAVI